ncbi:uncharacterized protein [Littorina saxatilis]|uniref:uncharacterized protein isoform X1 n=1 Tax=Littorina saxatilis TaxID=31220 RepID=UPI0038B607A6
MSKTMVAGFVLAVLSMGADCFQWSPGLQDNAVVYACARGTLSLPWNLTLSGGDSVMDIQWFYSGRSEAELIATEVRGHFLTLPAFSGRVRKIGNAGIEMDGVEAIARGNYSVEVVGQSAAGAVTTLRRSVFVFILDWLQTTDEHLHVTQQPVAEYNSTQQYQVVLRCGTFTHPTRPPFEVTWETPSGKTEQSSSYKDGSFLLKLPNPVEGGTYTCRLPPSAACLHDNRTGEATLTVDKMEARQAVLEARQASLENVNNELKTRVHDVESNNSDLTTKYNALESKNSDLTTKYNALESKNSDLTTKYNALESKNSDLTTKYNALESKNSDLTTKYNALESNNNDLTTKYNALKTEKDVLENLLLNQTVSFHARLDTAIQDLPVGSALILPTVVSNHGNAYNSSTGKFTAPYTATYCFLATTEDYSGDHISVLSLVVDGTEMDYVLTDVALFSQSASVHAVVHLTAGQKVWLNVPTTNNFFGHYQTAFSGFLVDHSQ